MALCTRSVSARAVARPAVRVASVKPVSRVIVRSTPVSVVSEDLAQRWRFLHSRMQPWLLCSCIGPLHGFLVI
jgi:hypothetical protein